MSLCFFLIEKRASPTHEITMIGISEQVNCNDLKLGWKWRLAWKVDGYRLQGKPHRSNPTHLYKSNTYIYLSQWPGFRPCSISATSCRSSHVLCERRPTLKFEYVVSSTWGSLIFANEKMKNFSRVKSIDPMLSYRFYVFHANQNITSPTLMFSRAHKIAVRIGYNFS